MSTLSALRMTVWLFAVCDVLLFILPDADAEDEVTAVYSKVMSKDYSRTKLLDGSFKPEEYFLKNGGRYDKPSGDASMDNKRFPDIARVIVEQLGTQNYRPGTDPQKGKLIIVVYWGTSITPNSSTSHGMERAQDITQDLNGNHLQLFGDYDMGEITFDQDDHNMTDLRNSAMLGYDWVKIHAAPPKFGNLYPEDQQLLNELEGERYFVVLLAYDCQAFLKAKKYKELWETRFSISTSDTNFTKALPKMAKDASSYFGRDSNGLQHLPEGKVNVGETKSLGEVEQPQK